jgi:hypothetical protein
VLQLIPWHNSSEGQELFLIYMGAIFKSRIIGKTSFVD